MIKINLLPEQYRIKRKDLKAIGEKYNFQVKPILYGATVVVAVLLLIIMIYPVMQRISLKRLQSKWTEIESEYTEVTQLNKEYKSAKKMLDTIDQILKYRVIWAARLNDISDSLPREIQLTELVTNDIKTQDAGGRKVLIISGIVPLHPGERAISDFIKNLSENNGFTKDFPEIKPPRTQLTQDGLKRFTLKCFMVEKDQLESVK